MRPTLFMVVFLWLVAVALPILGACMDYKDLYGGLSYVDWFILAEIDMMLGSIATAIVFERYDKKWYMKDCEDDQEKIG
jgi:hypothetical protein